MKKFEIIEDGRLSKSEMAELTGSDLSCKRDYGVQESCSEKMASFSSCPGGYSSCSTTTSALLTCDSYRGPTGPGGYGEVENPYEEAIDPPEDEWAGEG